MSAKKKTTRKPVKFDPIAIEVTLSQDADGSIRIAYAGTDDRTHFLGEFLTEAIAEAVGCEPELEWRGVVALPDYGF